MDSQYKKEMREISVPQELLEQTAHLMQEEQHRTPAKRRRPLVLVGGLAAAACLALVALSFLGHTQGSMILTDMEEGAVVPRVELQMGHLQFSELDNVYIVDPGGTLGPLEAQQERWETQRYLEYLGGDAALPAVPGHYTLAEVQAVVVLLDGSMLSGYMLLRYEDTAGEAELAVYLSGEGLPPQALSGAEDNSEIGGTGLFVGYRPDGELHAQFMKGDVGCVITASHTSQREFIEILVDFVLYSDPT